MKRAEAKREFGRWARSLPPGLAQVLIEVAGSTPALAWMMQTIREETAWWLTERDFGTHWRRYYKSPEAWAMELLREIGWLEDDPEDEGAAARAKETRLWVRSLVRGKPPRKLVDRVAEELGSLSQRELWSQQAYAIRLARIGLGETLRFATTPLEDPADAEAITRRDEFRERVRQSPSLAFFFHAVAPCYAEYGVTPWRLLAEATAAKAPKLDSLERLLRVDRKAFWLMQVMQTILRGNDPERRKTWLEACARAASAKRRCASLRALKYRQGRLMKRIAAAAGIGLTEPEVRQVFDWIAQTREGTLRDVDLPESSETFARRMRDQKTVGIELPYPEEKTRKLIRAQWGRAA